MNTVDEQKSLIRAALGRERLDLLINNVQVVNVYTGEIEPGAIGVKSGRIVTTDAKGLAAEQIFDGAGRYAVPGFIDSHVHIDSTLLTPANLAELIVPNGTPGYELSPPLRKLGWRASDTRELSFRGCAVPEGNLLGERGRGYANFLSILDEGRIVSVGNFDVGAAVLAFLAGWGEYPVLGGAHRWLPATRPESRTRRRTSHRSGPSRSSRRISSRTPPRPACHRSAGRTSRRRSPARRMGTDRFPGRGS